MKKAFANFSNNFGSDFVSFFSPSTMRLITKFLQRNCQIFRSSQLQKRSLCDQKSSSASGTESPTSNDPSSKSSNEKANTLVKSDPNIQLDPKPKKISHPKLIVIEDPDNFLGKKSKSKNEPIIGPDGVPYDPAEDEYYDNHLLPFKYPQYFTKHLGFHNAVETIKEDLSILKKGRIHKVREELGCPREVDICIFGGGIIGSAVAYFLKQKAPFGYKVAVVERDPTVGIDSNSLANKTQINSIVFIRIVFSFIDRIIYRWFTTTIFNGRKYLNVHVFS